MASSSGKVVLKRWEIKEFQNEWRKNQDDEFHSDKFYFGASQFLLYYNPDDLYEKDKFGITLYLLLGKQPLEVNVKIWFENSEGQKFQESIQKRTFGELIDFCEFKLKLSDIDLDPLNNVYVKNETLYICCEITDYQATISITDFNQQFHQDMWSMYKQGMHDAIIKLGQTEFKILKTLFMAHSEVFKSMFTLDFKEAKTSTVEINDISEQVMKQLIKWMYTCQIDDESAIENLYEAADKYQVHLLKTNCAEIMIKSLDNSNAFRRLILAVAHEENQLKDVAFNQIDKIPNNEAMMHFVSTEWCEFIQKKPAVAEEVKKAIVEKLKK